MWPLSGFSLLMRLAVASRLQFRKNLVCYSEIQSRGHLATNLAHRLSLKGCSDNFAEVFSHKKLFVVIKKIKIINLQMKKIENY